MKNMVFMAACIGALGVLGLTALYVPFFKRNMSVLSSTQESNTCNPEIVHLINQILLPEEQAIWQAFDTVGITKQTVDHNYDLWKDRIAQMHIPLSRTPISDDLQRTITDIQHKSQLPVSVRGFYAIGGDVCMSCSGYMYLSEQSLKKRSSHEQQFTILHELAHIYFNDDVYLAIIESLLGQRKNIICQTQPDHPLAKMSRFIEKRADLAACLQMDRGIEAYSQKMHMLIKQGMVHTSPEHPSITESLHMADRAHTYLNKQKQAVA